MRVFKKALLATAGGVEALLLIALIALPARAALAQTPAAPQTWQVAVGNTGPESHQYGFNAYYPEHLQVHAGDTITFSINAPAEEYHTVDLLRARSIPEVVYTGQAGGFAYPDTAAAGGLQRSIFFGEPATPCGRASQAPCSFDGTSSINSGALLSTAVAGAAGSKSFTANVASTAATGTYFFLCLVHGPTMSGSFDVVPASERVQSAESLRADAQRAYEVDVEHLVGSERDISMPGVSVNSNGTRSWSIAAGSGTADGRLGVYQFGVRNLVVNQGDTVTWTNEGGIGDQHTISGFGSRPGESPSNLAVYQPACSTTNGDVFPAAGAYGPDLWNGCPGSEELLLTQYAYPDPASGTSYTPGTGLTSGILMSQTQLNTPVERGSPFVSSYTVLFPQPGSYTYTCVIHPGMNGTIIVQGPPGS